jgi:DNA-binding Xre family transcriptional regulator
MTYAPPVKMYARLRSRAAFEAAMRNRDVNASELAALASTTRQNVSNIRRGATSRARSDTAAAIERALRCSRGELFDYDGATAETQTQAS